MIEIVVLSLDLILNFYNKIIVKQMNIYKYSIHMPSITSR